jgi:hypothetical protein
VKRRPVRVGLISCGAKKLGHAVPAADLYVGGFFRLSREWAERHCDSYYILSGKHGLLHPTETVMPYTMYLPDAPAWYREWWSRKVADQMSVEFSGRDIALSCIAPPSYRGFSDHIPWPVSFPMPPGLGIGRQLQWLRREIDA